MTCGHIGGSLSGENIQAPFPRGTVIEFTHVQKARLASSKRLQAFVHEKQHEWLLKGHQDPLASDSEATPSRGGKTFGVRGREDFEQNDISVKYVGRRSVVNQTGT